MTDAEHKQYDLLRNWLNRSLAEREVRRAAIRRREQNTFLLRGRYAKPMTVQERWRAQHDAA